MFTTLMARTAAITMAVYFSNRVGSWRNTDASDKLYQNLSRGLEPFRLSELARKEIGLKTLKHYDESIKEGYLLMQQLPNYTSQLVELAKSTYVELARRKSRKTSQNCQDEEADANAGEDEDEDEDDNEHNNNNNNGEDVNDDNTNVNDDPFNWPPITSVAVADEVKTAANAVSATIKQQK